MNTGLKGKVAIVTGGSKGIGKAITRALAEEGVSVAICARGMEALKNTAKEIESGLGDLGSGLAMTHYRNTRRDHLAPRSNFRPLELWNSSGNSPFTVFHCSALLS